MKKEFLPVVISRMGINLINLLLIVFLVLSASCFAKQAPAFIFSAGDENRQVVGNWLGTLDIMGNKLRIIFKVSGAGQDSLTALLDSPDQGAKNIPVSMVISNKDSVYFEVKIAAGYFAGKPDFTDNKIEGIWSQGGIKFPLVLEKIDKVEEVKRPQDPEAPFLYNEEEVTFENKEAGVTLAGTLTFPKEGSNFPVVILVSGSGPQNRNEELYNHRPFWVWADHLTRNGFAVLRYDDRGVGKSTGDFGTAITTDFATDAVSAVEYIKTRKEINPGKIGVCGHSEGGIIAPIAANKSKDVSFIVLAGGPAVPGNEIVTLQRELILRDQGIPEEDIKKQEEFYKRAFDKVMNIEELDSARAEIAKIIEEYYNTLTEEEKQKPENSKEAQVQAVNSIFNPWFKFFLKFDPRTELTKVSVPVLAMYGEKDLQVPPSQNKDEMEKALSKSSSKKYNVVVMPGVNHLFQETKGYSPMDYAKIEQTVSPDVLNIMTAWLKEVTK
jgi:pimeloyl-ACP methyl ester carboxylesterase